MIYTKTYQAPPFCTKEILRYSGCKEANQETLRLVDECIKESENIIKYSVCYRELSVVIDDDKCDFEYFSVNSKNLAKNLKGCRKVVVFAATIGIDFDRIIAKYSRLSPAKALIFQAIGSERAEALCDVFCDELAEQLNQKLRPRFSPGYGDLPLDLQRDIFSVLDCERKIGITLNDSLLMSPSKSVTAFVGLTDNSCFEV